MKAITVVLLSSALGLAGCRRITAEDYFAKAGEAHRLAQKQADTLKTLEHRLEVFKPALDLYETVVKEYPTSAQAESSSFLIATIRNSETRQPDLAVEAYKSYIRDFPNGKQVPVAMFMVGFIYNNELAQYDSAGAAYRRFLERFPQHEMAMAAQQELNNLGRPPDQWLPQNLATESPKPQAPAKSAKKGK